MKRTLCFSCSWNWIFQVLRLQRSTLPSDIPKKPRWTQPNQELPPRLRRSLQFRNGKYSPQKASGEAQPARWQNPLNRSPRAKICNSSVCKWEAPGLKCVWTPCAIVPLNFVGVSGSRTHVIKARNWLWNSVLPLLCSQISGQTPLLSCATSMQKYFGQDGNDYCQRQGLRYKTVKQSVKKSPAQSMGKTHSPYSFDRDVQTLQSAVHGLHHFEWLIDWLAKESLDQGSDPHLSVYCNTRAQGRSPWNSPYQWRFYIHLAVFVFLWLREGHSYHGSADDQVKMKVHVATRTICSAGGVTQRQQVWEPGILHRNQWRSPG